MNRIIGIDLGTTNSCAAYVSNKIPHIIPVEGGFNTMPSVVCVHPSGSLFVGQMAREQMIANPNCTLHGIKRLLGRQYASRIVQEFKSRVAYGIVAGHAGEAAIAVGNQTFSPVELQTKILSHIKRYAEINLGEEVPEVVIAVPAYYSDHQRTLVKEAGTKAGFEVRRIVNEPTAAALAYGFNRGFEQRILIYDLGGGTFDVSVLEIDGNVFQVVATGGDNFLGGFDFDNRIVEHLAAAFKKQTKIDLAEEPSAFERVRQAAERAKIELSLLVNTQVRVPGLVERRGRPIDLDVQLDRDTLNQLTVTLVERTVAVTDGVLSDSGLSIQDIDEIVFVGGQTRMPLVIDTISRHFGKQPRKGVNPDESVALGAALLGDSLAKIDAVTLLDAISVPIGITAPDGTLRIIIDKHTLLPHRASVEVPTTADGQTEMHIDVCQGEPGPIVNTDYLGTLSYKGIPPGPMGSAAVKIDFSLDAEGMLTLTAVHNKGGQPEVMQLATRERVLPIVDAAPATTSGQEPAVADDKSGLRGFVRGLWGRPK